VAVEQCSGAEAGDIKRVQPAGIGPSDGQLTCRGRSPVRYPKVGMIVRIIALIMIVRIIALKERSSLPYSRKAS
jgi:hypothetical protein